MVRSGELDKGGLPTWLSPRLSHTTQLPEAREAERWQKASQPASHGQKHRAQSHLTWGQGAEGRPDTAHPEQQAAMHSPAWRLCL